MIIKQKRLRPPPHINKETVIKERKEKLAKLKQLFMEAISQNNRQEAGYTLENILNELFQINEIEYKKSYKTATQQIDGFFNFDGFDYLVEAKWRQDQPTEGEIGTFKRKIDTKIVSTRGFFISIPGFREQVLDSFNGQGNNIIFVDGADLMLVLEGYVDLKDALRFKIERAVQYGEAFISLKSKFV